MKLCVTQKYHALEVSKISMWDVAMEEETKALSINKYA